MCPCDIFEHIPELKVACSITLLNMLVISQPDIQFVRHLLLCESGVLPGFL